MPKPILLDFFQNEQESLSALPLLHAQTGALTILLPVTGYSKCFLCSLSLSHHHYGVSSALMSTKQGLTNVDQWKFVAVCLNFHTQTILKSTQLFLFGGTGIDSEVSPNFFLLNFGLETISEPGMLGLSSHVRSVILWLLPVPTTLNSLANSLATSVLAGFQFSKVSLKSFTFGRSGYRFLFEHCVSDGGLKYCARRILSCFRKLVSVA